MWKSILSARNLLVKGLKKIVGSGNNKCIWEDPWIPSLPNFRVLSEVSRGEDGPRMVCELIEDGIWDLEKLSLLFSEWEVESIKNIPLPQSSGDDKWAWHYTKHGEFSVRSAYYVELKNKKREEASSSINNSQLVWRRLWHAQVPTKVKLFGWRALHNGIAVRDNLYKRGCSGDRRCPMCGEEFETSFHALANFKEIQWLWRTSPLRIEVKQDGVRSFRTWCESLASLIKEECWCDMFWSILWGIWLRRNAWCFEGKNVVAQEVLQRVCGSTQEYQIANEVKFHQSPAGRQEDSRWKPPDTRKFKINSDAAVFDNGKVGCGGVIRDEVGDIMGSTCMLMEGRLEVDVAEAVAARHALTIAMEAGFREVILESDSLKLISHLKKAFKENSSFGNIVGDILVLASECSFISFNHVRRNGNKVAHEMAHLSRSFSEMCVWMEEIPLEVYPSVISDLEMIE